VQPLRAAPGEGNVAEIKGYYDEARERLIAEIALDVRETARYLGTDTLDPRVVAAIRKVPRDEFVPSSERDLAYINRPLPIGHGQTISQPFIVAIMTDMLAIAPESRVLEIGTGCGYQVAILAELAARVYTIEVVAPLAEAARERLSGLGYANIEYRVGDGGLGWPEEAPFDRIIVTAAAPGRPDALIAQLGLGGRMVVPVGRAGFTQTLTLIERDAEGRVTETPKLPVAFVPLVEKRWRGGSATDTGGA
jgi:protein-L-isoaspartate(D-aspartate) O-methyltransferase